MIIFSPFLTSHWHADFLIIKQAYILEMVLLGHDILSFLDYFNTVFKA